MGCSWYKIRLWLLIKKFKKKPIKKATGTSPFFVMKQYSIIIPIHNELNSIPALLEGLQCYIDKGHEVIIVDDGSNDGSTEILESSKEINLIKINKNRGKGYALKEGLKGANYKRIIIYDGDLELNPSEISKLMILNKKTGIRAVVGYRFESVNPLKSNFDLGNFMFTSFFNILFQANNKDILCCAKAFLVDDIKSYELVSNRFDVDIELYIVLAIYNKNKIIQVPMNYIRRNFKEGKKLRLSDGWSILARIFKLAKYF